MQSLKELYKIGIGPSSSHTIGPEKIAEFIKAKYPNANKYKVILYGSLALTGRGHGTDAVLKKVLGQQTEIEFNKTEHDLPHPNTLDVIVFDQTQTKTIRAVSVGGGSIKIDGEKFVEPQSVYSLKSFTDIKKHVEQKGQRLYEYVYQTEPDVKEYLKQVWAVMKESVERGLNK